MVSGMENEPLVIVGSKGRPHLPVLKWIPSPIVLVEPQEMDLYEAARKERGSSETLVELPENNRGFAYMMNACVTETLARGRKWFLFSDDDVTAVKSRARIEDKFSSLAPEDVPDWIRRLRDEAAHYGLSQYAVSFAGASWGAKKALDKPVGAWGVHLSNAEHIKSVGGYDESLIIFNDWELSARLITYGYWTGRTNLITFIHKMRGMKGGAEGIYEKKDEIRTAAERIVAKYPGAARLKEAHGLTEVRFNWRKLAGL